MPRVFLSYRRENTSGVAGRLYERLRSRLGRRRVFRDLESIPPGADFPAAIADAVQSCSVLIAVIGRHWLTIRDAEGQRRLDDPEDLVAREIALALDGGVRVIPVLVDGASIPPRKDLPATLDRLADLNALRLSDDHWDSDIERLLEALSVRGPFPPSRKARSWVRWRSWQMITILLIALLASGAGVFYYGISRQRQQEKAPTSGLHVTLRHVPVLGIVHFGKESADERLEGLADELEERIRAILEGSHEMLLPSQEKMEQVSNAAGTGGDIHDFAADSGIDFLLTWESSPDGLSLQVAGTRPQRHIGSMPLNELTQETLDAKAEMVARRTRAAMGLPPAARRGTWAANFLASNPAAYKPYLDGLEALDNERFEQAEGFFSVALRKAPDFTMARYRLAWAYALAGYTEQARGEIAQMAVAAAALDDREKRYVAAARLYFLRDYEEAISAYEELIKKYRFEVEARQHLAQLYLDTKRYDEAIELWNWIQKLEPRVAARKLGDTYLQSEQYDQAVQVLEKATGEWPDDARAHGLLGNAYQARGELDRAAREYDAALPDDRDKEPLYDIMIASYVLQALRGHPEEAVHGLALLVDPDTRMSVSDKTDAGFQLAYLLMARGRFGQAGKVLENLADDFDAEEITEASALSVRAQCAMEVGELQKARALVAKAIAKAPKGHPRTRYLFTRGLLELRLEATDHVRLTAEEIRREGRGVDNVDQTEDKAVAYLVGMAALAQGRLEPAIQFLSTAVSLSGYEYRIYRLGLARAYLAVGQRDKALQAAEEAARLQYLDDPRLDLELDRKRAIDLKAEIEKGPAA